MNGRGSRRVVPMLLAALIAMPAAAAPTPTVPVTIVDSQRWDMPSAVAGRSYRISVYRPPVPPPKDGFPVVYVVDGDVFFPLAVGQMLIRRNGEIRPAIIVGISYPTDDVPEIVRLRTRDLTPAPMSADVLKEMAVYKATAADGGGAELFYRFLVEELRPLLAARYAIDAKHQTLFGHSLGGLFALHVLFNHPAAFSTYVAASPSIAWSDRAILKDIDPFKARLRAVTPKPSLLLTVGGDESNPDAFPKAPMSREAAAAIMAKSPMVGNLLALARQLGDPVQFPGLLVESRVFPDENHLSVQPESIGRALTFALALPTWGKPCDAPCASPPRK